LEALKDLGGKGEVANVLKRVERKMKTSLRAVDYKKTATGMLRWRKSAMWKRKAMVDEGLLSPNSPRGAWELTPKGRALLP
jgi:hypothetical protein